MNDRFTKVFESILDSSIWFESSDTRCVWFTLMALADQDGNVSNTIPGLARRAFPRPSLEVAIQLTEAAIQLFMSPDEYSRSSAEEGKRLQKIEGGWHLINHEAYRNRRKADDRKEQNRAAQQRQRDRKRESARVSSRGKGQQESAQAEAEEEAEEGSPQPPGGGGDSKSSDPLLAFAVAWRKSTGRKEFQEFVQGCGQVGGTEQQWLRNASKASGGSVREFVARVEATLAEDKDRFWLKQSLNAWERGPLQAPAVAPKPSTPTAAYHSALKPRADDGPAVTFDEAMADRGPAS